jgi:septal ring factor EnvC (AmiA/AmiB activator)
MPADDGPRYDAFRRWSSAVTFIVGLCSGAAGLIIGATWQVASYDSRLSALASGGTTQAAALAAASIRLTAIELAHSSIGERQNSMQHDTAELQDNAKHVNDRLDALRDQAASLREVQAGMSAQLSFLYQHGSGTKR